MIAFFVFSVREGGGDPNKSNISIKSRPKWVTTMLAKC